MKTALVIISFFTLSLSGFAQQDKTAETHIESLETSIIAAPAAKKSTISAKYKAKVLKINRKKSIEIISIKAYRKSLHIKVKTKKLC